MAGFKEQGHEHSEHAVERALFEDFNPEIQGGLLVLGTGQIAEVRHPGFSLGDGDASIAARTAPLPLWITDEGIEWRPDKEWTGTATLGGETEIAVMDQDGWYPILPDGETIQHPDGSTESAEKLGFQVELLKQMVEFGTPIADGFTDYRRRVIDKAVEVEEWLKERQLHAPALSVYPEQFNRTDGSGHPYVQMMLDRMPHVLEFGVMSDQLHVQMKSVEAAAFALNNYQRIQALFGYITASAPIRDGSFDTTMHEHYRENPAFQTSRNPLAYIAMVPENDMVMEWGDQVPYDWRELSRTLGSPSAGAFETAAPLDAAEFLRQGDKKLRNGDIVSVVRTLGWHADRLRLDYGTVEICNFGRSGGNLYKQLAAQEVMSKFIVALQEHYHNPGQAGDLWVDGLIAEPDNIRAQQDAVEAGHINNFLMAMHGAGRGLIVTPEGDDSHSYEVILDEVIEFSNSILPEEEQISDVAADELRATLRPCSKTWDTPEGVFAYFYSPNSRMTANDALCMAHAIDPDISIDDLLRKFADARADHVVSARASEMSGIISK